MFPAHQNLWLDIRTYEIYYFVKEFLVFSSFAYVIAFYHHDNFLERMYYYFHFRNNKMEK